MDKKTARLRRSKRTREHIKRLNVNRLSVHRTPKHIYVQLIDPNGQIITSASTLDSNVKSQITFSGNIEAAKKVGKLIAERCQNAGITKVAFDRSGFKYHGRVKALADAARENGLEI